MVLTTLEATVSPKKWNELRMAFEKLRNNPPAGSITPVQAWLVQSRDDVNVWRLIGLWRSREEFDRMRAQGTPRGMKMFQDLDAEPALSIYDVVASMGVSEPVPTSPH